MAADVVQSNYDQLDDIAGRFARQAERSSELHRRVAQALQSLEQGGWEGHGAAAFFGEMRGELQPASQRLIAALQEAQSVTLRIKTIMQQAEREAAAPFVGSGLDGDAGEIGGSVPLGAGSSLQHIAGGSAGGGAAQSTPGPTGGVQAAPPGSSPKDQLHAALSGTSVNATAITQALNGATDKQKAEILADPALMARLRAGLSAEQFRGVAGQLVDVANVPKGALQTQVAELVVSAREIDNNTALHLVNGTVRTYAIEELRQPANIDAILKSHNKTAADYTVYLEPPANTKYMIVQKNFRAFASDGSNKIFLSNAAPVEEIRRNLVHETNHARNARMMSPVQQFKGEFRAYWVDGGEFDPIADPGKRADAIRERVLEKYPAIKKAYDADSNVKRAIDGHTVPDGNLTNR